MGLKYANNAKTTLNGAHNSSTTTITVVDGSVFPTLGAGDYFYMTLEDTSLNNEIVKVTARSTNTLTVVRAQNGTTAKSFSTADKAEGRLVAAVLDDLFDLTANIKSWLADPTSAKLLAAMLDKTGTGSLVFATSPTFVTPLLGTPTSGVLTNCTGLPNTSVIGLGTAALATIGTSGDTVPKNNTANTWSAAQTYTANTPIILQSDQAALHFKEGGGSDRFLLGIRSDVTSNDTDFLLYSLGVGTVFQVPQSTRVADFKATPTVNGDPIMTRGAAETISGTKTFSASLNMANNVALGTVETGGVIRATVKMNASNVMEFGNVNNNAVFKNFTNTFERGVIIAGDAGANPGAISAGTNYGMVFTPYTNAPGIADFAWLNRAQTAIQMQLTGNNLTLTGNLSVGNGNTGGVGRILVIDGADNKGSYVSYREGGGSRWHMGRNITEVAANNNFGLYNASAGIFAWTVSVSTNDMVLYNNITVPGQVILGGGGQLWDQSTTRTILSANGNVFDCLTENNGAYIFSASTAGIQAADFTLTSDERLKKDFVQFKDALAIVRQLRGGEYTRISTGKREYGLMAQDFERAGVPLFVDNTTSTKSLKYPRTPALLVEAIKELADKVEALEARLAA